MTKIHDLPEAEKVCVCGCALTRIGEEVSEKLDIVPAHIQFERNVRDKYACRAARASRVRPGVWSARSRLRRCLRRSFLRAS